MPRKFSLFFLQYFLGTFISVFGIVWLLLEPLGGLDYVIGIKNQKLVFYIILTIVSSLISAIVYNSKTYSSHLAEAAKTKDTLAEAGEDRSTYNYLQLLKGARQSVDLLGLSLAPFSTEQYINTLYELIEQNVRINILMSNPLSPNLAQRHKSLYTVNEDVRNATAATLKTLIKLKRSIGARKKELLSVRVMNILPHYGLFKVDSTMLWNPYFAKRTGLGSPYFIVQEDSLWARFLAQDFAVLSNEYSFPIDEETSVENLRDYLREDRLIYENYGDEETMNQIRPFFL
jgi:hypothetical protein